jgi:hypothetical protein
MDQNNTPFDNNPQQPPREPFPPAGQPGGAQVYEGPPSYQQPGGPTYPPAAPPPARTNRTWLIVLIVVLVLCCCCVAALLLAWNMGDSFLLTLCEQDPTLPFCGQLP